MRTHLATLFEDFRRFGRGVAVVRMQGNRRRVTTYEELARLAGRFGALLEDRSIGPGDRVLVWAENSAEWIAAFYGCMLRGVLAVPLDAFGSAEFAARVAEDVRPKLAVGDAALLDKLPREWPVLAFEAWETSLPAREAGPVDGLGPETPLQILFTSGTTGEPKGIVHTHGNVLASVEPIAKGARPYMRWEKLVHPLRFLHTLPLSHVFGQTMGLWVPAIFAAEVHFESRLVAPRLIETIKKERISVLAAVPRVMGLLKTHLESSIPGLDERVENSRRKKLGAAGRWWQFRDVHRTLGLKFWALISGGGALAEPLEQFWNAVGFVVVQGYGMTETTALITLNHPFHVASGTIGKPLPGREVKIGPDGEVLVRGPMIASSTWSGGAMQTRGDEWLATGDLAETQATGELKFLGRKSEVIVTAAGVNIHPEDVEAALEQEPGVVGSAVVAVETANGPEPFAVLAVRGGATAAGAAVERANERLAEFQRVRRWAVWPEPDLPRTSTGKVRRKAAAAWAARSFAANGSANGSSHGASHGSGQATNGDWLLAMVAEIAGEMPASTDDQQRLTEDLHLDSLGRVQLAAALEERLGGLPVEGELDRVHTLGELRELLGSREQGIASRKPSAAEESAVPRPVAAGAAETAGAIARDGHAADAKPIAWPVGEETETYLYPRWPWWRPVAWVRSGFLELIAQPLVWFLAGPRVTGRPETAPADPMLIVCNHVTAFDGALVDYALPGRMRRRVAAMMSGEMLEDYLHFRDPDRRRGERGFMLLGPAAYFLVTALYNVFPLPRKRDFQRSFRHAGEALDRGYNVLVFPEGTRSAAGELARFRPGIGLLVKESHTAVLPVAIRGLGELKARGRGWFRSGKIEVRVGVPMRFDVETSEAAITERLHAAVERLLKG